MKKLILIVTAIICAQAAAMSATAQELGFGDKFQDCEKCPEMIVVPPGSFQMGSPATEEERWRREGPVHEVAFANPFAVGIYEITFSEWDYCVAQGGCDRYRPPSWDVTRVQDMGWGRGRRPVINVSWDDAKAYVSWLSKRTKKSYRLLTEAEWEYAARAGTTTSYHFGSTITTSQANYKGNHTYGSVTKGIYLEQTLFHFGNTATIDRANYNGNYTYGSGTKGIYREQTLPVGSFSANKFGLHDVHGNVWEWVEDCWHSNYNNAPTDGSAWLGTHGGDCSHRVVRGGSWYSKPQFLRSAHRSRPRADYRHNSRFGFRIALTLTP